MFMSFVLLITNFSTPPPKPRTQTQGLQIYYMPDDVASTLPNAYKSNFTTPGERSISFVSTNCIPCHHFTHPNHVLPPGAILSKTRISQAASL
jgi:hypothetical protein